VRPNGVLQDDRAGPASAPTATISSAASVQRRRGREKPDGEINRAAREAAEPQAAVADAVAGVTARATRVLVADS